MPLPAKSCYVAYFPGLRNPGPVIVYRYLGGQEAIISMKLSHPFTVVLFSSGMATAAIERFEC